ncbi:response regulator, partial [Acinetobacter baumannii]
MRILVVEDDAVLRDGIVRLLNAQGYAVECAGGGGEALDLAALTRPDLIVLDLSLPDLDGLDVLRALRNGRDRTPVLILSARSELP